MEFNLPTSAFSQTELESLIKKALTTNKYKYVYKYINSYFYKMMNPLSCLFYAVNMSSWIEYTLTDVLNLLPKCITGELNIGGKIISVKFDCRDWFKNNDYFWFKTMNAKKPKLFIDNKSKYFNLFDGQLYPYVKYDTFDNETKKGVDFIFNHIKTCWCNDNEALYKYVKNWIVNLVCYKKNYSYLYLKADEGVGKSIITDFIANYVLTQSSISMSSSKCLYSFNKELEGKNLVILEELQAGKDNWGAIKDGIKNIVTNPKLRIEAKGKDSYDIDNIVNLIINTNNDAVGKIGLNDRRLVSLDISNKYMGNVKYFNELATYTNDETIAQAFYCYCVENLDVNFKSNILPITESKKELIIESLPTVLQFIKSEFVIKNIGINMTFDNLYKSFVEWSQMHEMKVTGKILTSKLLRNNKIDVSTGTNNILYVNANHKELLQLYQTKNWISEIDQYSDVKKNIIVEKDELEDENEYNLYLKLKEKYEKKHFTEIIKDCEEIISQEEEQKKKKIETFDDDEEEEEEEKKKKPKRETFEMVMDDVLNAHNNFLADFE